jgi:polyadenylate-binding protein
MIHAFPQVILHLDPAPPSASPPPNWPPPAATPRVVSSLPPTFSDSKLFDTFRGFGAIASCRMHPDMGQDIGVVTFWREEDATRAEEVMHMSEVDDYNISVKVWLPMRDMRKQKGLEFNPQAPSFVPSGLSQSTLPGGITHNAYPHGIRHHAASPPLQPFSLSPMPSPHLPLANHSPMMMPGAQLPVMVSHSPLLFFSSSPDQSYSQYSPPRMPMPFPRSPTMSPFVHGPGQQVQFAPPVGPGSTSASGLIDPCNLFCKVGVVARKRSC